MKSVIFLLVLCELTLGLDFLSSPFSLSVMWINPRTGFFTQSYYPLVLSPLRKSKYA